MIRALFNPSGVMVLGCALAIAAFLNRFLIG